MERVAVQDKEVEATATAAAAAAAGEEGKKEGAKRVGGEREKSGQQASVWVEMEEVVGAEEERWRGKGRMTSEAAEVKAEEGAEEGE